MRIDRALRGPPKEIWPAEREDAPSTAPLALLVDGQRGLAGAAPKLLIRIGEDRVAHVCEARAGIRAILGGHPLDSEELGFHASPSRPSVPLAFSTRRGAGSNDDPEEVVLPRSVVKLGRAVIATEVIFAREIVRPVSTGR